MSVPGGEPDADWRVSPGECSQVVGLGGENSWTEGHSTELSGKNRAVEGASV